MTAQIAILNKHGIALATDSAVTITGNDNQKVYNTANKLFSLTDNGPVGVMIYGAAQFMGIPWETIIKTYRNDNRSAEPFDTLQEYCDDFVEYIKNNQILNNNYAFETTLIRKLTVYLKIVLNQVKRTMDELKIPEGSPELVGDIIQNEVNRLLYDVMEKIAFFEGFNQDVVEDIISNYNSTLDGIINQNIFVDVDEEGRNNIKRLIVTLLAKDFYTDSSGLVIAGYGKNEIFPSLFEFNIEGIFEGTLKYRLVDKKIISSDNSENNTTASITAFAQKEMVETFTGGIDPRFKEEVFEAFYSILLDEYPKILMENIGKNLSNDEEQKLSILSNDIVNQIRDEVKRFQYKNYSEPIYNTIQLMPKEEMAIVAETLLNLASLKKRVTMDTESVGGPIDVAIISKNDGLIWIKRKHYFNPELNHRYFKNN